MNFSQSLNDQHSIYASNWQQMYNQLLYSYYQLSQNYRTAVNKNFELTQELKQKNHTYDQTEKLFIKNSEKVQSRKTLPEDSEVVQETIREIEKVDRTKDIKKRRSQRKRKSTTSNQYTCSYPECNRCYDSSVSLNLHIKLKHNGGTKKQRQTYAKMIIDAEEKGLQPPKISINFPPNFIESIFITNPPTEQKHYRGHQYNRGMPFRGVTCSNPHRILGETNQLNW